MANTTQNLIGSYIPSVNYTLNGTSYNVLDLMSSPIVAVRNRITDVIITFTLVLITWDYYYRPELLAYDYLGDPALFWVICRYNGIVSILDETQGFIPGLTVKVPNSNDVQNWLQTIRAQQNTTGNFLTV